MSTKRNQRQPGRSFPARSSLAALLAVAALSLAAPLHFVIVHHDGHASHAGGGCPAWHHITDGQPNVTPAPALPGRPLLASVGVDAIADRVLPPRLSILHYAPSNSPPERFARL